MTNRKSTKRALLTSILAMLLCIVMLLGTTYAWFTDSVVSGKNKIVAGNLDVALEYSVDDMKTWNDVEGATDLFNAKALWEPGHTEVVYLRVKNVGTLALNYNLSVAVDKEVPGTNVNNESFLLSKYLKFGVVETSTAYAERADARKAVEATAGALSTYSAEAKMLPTDDAKTMALVVYMPETVGNEANYKTGTTAPSVELGVTLLATQIDEENDSFGKDYDAQELVLLNGIKYASLADAIEAAAEGDTIKISGEVTWVTGASHGSTPFAKAVTIEGMDKTATLVAVGSGVGPLGAVSGLVTFKNLTIKDESVSYAESNWELGYLEFRGELLFENVTFVNAIQIDKDNGQNLNSKATFKNCTFNSYKDSEYDVWFGQGEATFENCTFEGYRGLKIAEIYGSDVTSVTIDGCKFLNLAKKPGIAIDCRTDDTTAIVIKNSTFSGTQAGEQGNYIYETDNTVPTLENNTVEWVLTEDLVIGTAGEYSKALIVNTAKDLVINGNGHKIIMTGNTRYSNGTYEQSPGIIANGAAVTVKNATIVNNKTFNNGTSAGSRFPVYTFVKADSVAYENVVFEGGVVVYDPTTFTKCEFYETDANRYALFCDNQYGGNQINVTMTECVVNANGSYGCVKVADNTNEGGSFTATGCTFYNESGKSDDVYANGTVTVTIQE